MFFALLSAFVAQPPPLPVPPPVAASPAPAPAPSEAPAQRARVQAESLASYVSPDDYPSAALRRGAQGRVGFRLVIDREGRVSRCVVTRTSGHDDLDKTTCDIMAARARFDPARDQKGDPVEDVAHQTIVWRLQSEPQGAPFEAFRVATTITATSTGHIRCSLEVNDQAQTDLPDELCRNNFPFPEQNMIPSGGRVEFTAVVAFTPEGATPAGAGQRNYGPVVGEAAAEIGISPDGSVGDCRVTQLTGRAQEAPDLCSFLRNGAMPPFAQTRSSSPRRGTYRSIAHLLVLAPS